MCKPDIKKIAKQCKGILEINGLKDSVLLSCISLKLVHIVNTVSVKS